ncbi:hypothetical protein BDW74DRAFT_171060 [Aspergillus multicolor]|uniref:5'-methylthioadenosine/S-adenosylhomocysteine nucleosidase family protein n=1 Tax=Aspergillus multicolor TaxID=41759 RepID=UPI003CCCF06C
MALTSPGPSPAAPKPLTHQSYHIAILCPLEIELSAVRYMLDEEHPRLPSARNDPNVYILGKLSGHNVVLVALPEGSQGTVAAATVATHLWLTFPKARRFLCVGIGGGVPSRQHDVRLGDVVIGAPVSVPGAGVRQGGVVEYDLGIEGPNGFRRTSKLAAPPAEWVGIVKNMAAVHQARGNRIDEFIAHMLRTYPMLRGAYQRPPPERDVLFQPQYIHPAQGGCGRCDRRMVVPRPRRSSPATSHVSCGIIASGNRVMKDAVKRDKIAGEAGGALCFEMEAAGMMKEYQAIVIRGIADYCDSHKNDDWHGYAAAAAAATAKEMLMYLQRA